MDSDVRVGPEVGHVELSARGNNRTYLLLLMMMERLRLPESIAAGSATPRPPPPPPRRRRRRVPITEHHPNDEHKAIATTRNGTGTPIEKDPRRAKIKAVAAGGLRLQRTHATLETTHFKT